jgi:6-phosphogluconolactonase
MMKREIRIFETPALLANSLADDIVRRIVASASREKPYSVALSGGSSPELLYSFLFDEFADSIPWEFVHLFWSDERCVPPDDADSNFGMVQKHLVQKTGLPSQNVHRIKGEGDPIIESARYSGELSSMLPMRNEVPVLDLILLGMGEDGHTASIFPGRSDLLSSERLCEVAVHPKTGQKRITLTLKVINNSEAVVFIVTGKNKAGVLSKILGNEAERMSFPVAHVKPEYGSIDWYIDKLAGSFLDETISRTAQKHGF